jgi:hypothetical protein
MLPYLEVFQRRYHQEQAAVKSKCRTPRANRRGRHYRAGLLPATFDKFAVSIGKGDQLIFAASADDSENVVSSG